MRFAGRSRLHQRLQQRDGRRDPDAFGRLIVPRARRGHLPCGDVRELRVEIAERRTHHVIVEAAFHRQQRRPPLDDDEVDLPSVGIAKVPEIQLTTLRVLLEVHPLQQVGGDEILEARSCGGRDRIPEGGV